jgi:putative glycosyltransferase (TIGR04348 family)
MREPSHREALRIVIVSPALADANNGNWQTARRWQRLLAPHRARIVREWPDASAPGDQMMVALHARRSAPAIAAWHTQHGSMGLGVVLTGTDLYKDLKLGDPSALRSLEQARGLAVLQALASHQVPQAQLFKVTVIRPSSPERRTLAKTSRHLRTLMVGHLRDEKDPLTLMRAAALLTGEPDILIDHIGAALDPDLGAAARDTAARCPNYRWLGALPHAQTLARIQRAHLLVHTSRMEGGAHVLIEAIRSGTPVLVSNIVGNLGLLTDDYPGVFALGNAPELAQRLKDLRRAQQINGLNPASAASATGSPPSSPDALTTLRLRCASLSGQYSPGTEAAALAQWITSLGKAQ